MGRVSFLSFIVVITFYLHSGLFLIYMRFIELSYMTYSLFLLFLTPFPPSPPIFIIGLDPPSPLHQVSSKNLTENNRISSNFIISLGPCHQLSSQGMIPLLPRPLPNGDVIYDSSLAEDAVNAS